TTRLERRSITNKSWLCLPINLASHGRGPSAPPACAPSSSAKSGNGARLSAAARNELERLASELHAIAGSKRHDEPLLHLAPVLPGIEPLGAACDALVDARARELEDEITAAKHQEDLAPRLHRDAVRAPALLDRHVLGIGERLDHGLHERRHDYVVPGASSLSNPLLRPCGLLPGNLGDCRFPTRL